MLNVKILTCFNSEAKVAAFIPTRNKPSTALNPMETVPKYIALDKNSVKSLFTNCGFLFFQIRCKEGFQGIRCDQFLPKTDSILSDPSECSCILL